MRHDYSQSHQEMNMLANWQSIWGLLNMHSILNEKWWPMSHTHSVKLTALVMWRHANKVRVSGEACRSVITWLIGQWESVHGMGWRFWFLVVPVALRGGSGRRRDWQVTKPSCWVWRTPAQVPANAPASIKTGDLTEDCKDEGQETEKKRGYEWEESLEYTTYHI